MGTAVSGTILEFFTGTKGRLTLNFGANIYSLLVTVLYHLATVPLFLSVWPKELYGEWLVLWTVPGYIALSNVGLSSVLGNNMTIAMGAGNTQRAKEYLHTIWGAQLFINLVVAGLLCIFVIRTDLSAILKFNSCDKATASLAFCLLALLAMINLQITVLAQVYRAVGLNARGVVALNSVRLMCLLFVAGGLAAGVRQLVGVAALLLIAQIIGSLFIYFDTARVAPSLRPGVAFFRWFLFKQDIRHGLAFMAYPIGYSFTNQGLLLVVNSISGAGMVVIVSSLQTVVRLAFQYNQMISQSTWPEFSRLYGEKNITAVRKLFCIATGAGMWGCLGCSAVLMIFGTTILRVWTRGAVDVSRGVLGLFLVPMVFNGIWYTASTVLNSTNRHHRIAVCFLLGAALVPVIVLSLHYLFGWDLFAAGLGLMIFELVMVVAVIPLALPLVSISLTGWMRQVFLMPAWVAGRFFYFLKERSGNE